MNGGSVGRRRVPDRETPHNAHYPHAEHHFARIICIENSDYSYRSACPSDLKPHLFQ
jgi:hypothetical protein